ncbi:hypothetical protein ACIGW7_13580 [Streptomyces sp. NPDC053253]|uniref:hypothetical protein n=1 Tax=Streptomyces sp. NPDC053253 TaxID=3365699 RepID=UPI0037D2EA98
MPLQPGLQLLPVAEGDHREPLDRVHRLHRKVLPRTADTADTAVESAGGPP